MAWGSVTAANQEQMKPILMAMYNLRNDANFKVILDWLRGLKKEEEKASPDITEDIRYRWSQGRLQVLNGVLDNNDSAEKTLRDILEK